MPCLNRCRPGQRGWKMHSSLCVLQGCEELAENGRDLAVLLEKGVVPVARSDEVEICSGDCAGKRSDILFGDKRVLVDCNKGQGYADLGGVNPVKVDGFRQASIRGCAHPPAKPRAVSIKIILGCHTHTALCYGWPIREAFRKLRWSAVGEHRHRPGKRDARFRISSGLGNRQSLALQRPAGARIRMRTRSCTE